MPNWSHLSDFHGEGGPRVTAWDDGNGIEIDAPGCGTAQLMNHEARALLAWLNNHYILDELADV